MNSTLSHLPSELKLKILSYLDRFTIRQRVSLINNEFNSLSRDFFFHKQYKSADYDYHGVKTKNELDHEAFRHNLQVLSTQCELLRDIAHLSFTGLRELILQMEYDDSPTMYLDREMMKNLTNRSITLNAEVSACVISDKLIPMLKVVETVTLQTKGELRSFTKIPAHRYIIGTQFLTYDDILLRLAEADLRAEQYRLKIGISITSNKHVYPFEEPANILNEKFSDMMRLHVVRFSWKFDCSRPLDRQLFTTVCRDWVSLTDMTLQFDSTLEIPVISCFASKRLKSLKIYNFFASYEESREILNSCKLIMNCVHKQLTISYLKIRSLPNVQLHVEKVVFKECELSNDLLYALPDSAGSLEIWKCEIPNSSTNPGQKRRIADLKFSNPSIDTLTKTMNAVDSNITKLHIVSFYDSNMREVPAQIGLLCSLREFQISSNVVSCEVDDFLEALQGSRKTLRVLHLSLDDSSVTKRTLDLLSNYIELECFRCCCSVKISRDEIRELYPTAIIDIRASRYLTLFI